MALRAVAARFTPNPDQWLLASFLGCGVAYLAWDRGRWRTRLDQAGRATPSELAALQQGIPVEERAALQASGMPVASDPLADLESPETFVYPPGSRSLSGVLFWACCAFSAGMFLPLVRGTLNDPGNDWVLFLLGCLFLLAALGYRRQTRFLGRQVTVDGAGLTDRSPSGAAIHISWASLQGARRLPFSRGFVFRDVSGVTIEVGPHLRGYGRFLWRVVAFLRGRHGAS